MPGEATISTGFPVFLPPCFASTPDGKEIILNGLARGLIWDGLTSSAELLGITGPTVAPTVGVSGAGGGATAGDYIMYYRYIDDEGFPSNLSPVASVTAVANNRFDWSVIANGETRVATKQLWRSLAGAPEAVYLVTSIANGGATTYTDTFTDAALETHSSLPILNPNGSAFANAFTPPPNFMSVVIMHGDRAWYGVPAIYSEGTVSVTAAGTNIAGVGTAFTSAMVGRYIYMVGDTVGYQITAYVSPTSLTIGTHSGALTGVAFSIHPGPTYRNAWMYSSQWDAPDFTGPEAVLGTNIIKGQESPSDDDIDTAGIPFGPHIYIARDRHVLRLSVVSQGSISPQIDLVAFRGCLNQRCWCEAEGVLYLMDQFGVWKFTGEGGAEPVSGPVQNYFREGTVDFSKSKWFSAHVRPELGYLFFLVAFTGDSGTRPKRALVFNYRESKWETDQFEWEIGGAARVAISGKARTLLGTEDDLVMLADEGTLDGLDSTTETGTIRGTVTSATSTTITDSTATFPTNVATANCPVFIAEGTGKGQRRRVITRTSATTLEVDSAWTTALDETSVYVIAGIPCSAKFGQYPWQSAEQSIPRGLALNVDPVTHDTVLNASFYLNEDSTALEFPRSIPSDAGDGVQTTDGESEAECDLTKESGYLMIHLDAQTDPQAQQPNYITTAISAVQGVDRVTIKKAVLLGIGKAESEE